MLGQQQIVVKKADNGAVVEKEEAAGCVGADS